MKYKNVFAEDCAPSQSEEVIEDFNREEITGMFTKKNCKRPIQQNL